MTKVAVVIFGAIACVLLTATAAHALVWTGHAYLDKTWDSKTETVITTEKAAYCLDFLESYESGEITRDRTVSWYAVHRGETDVMPGRLEVTNKTINIIICDGAYLEFEQGIHVAEDGQLNIYAQSEGEDQGTLVCGSPEVSYIKSHDGLAGIGGNKGTKNGSITIYGGAVKAYAGNHAAAIGGGSGAKNGPITIYGGNVFARGSDMGAGIGGGDCSNKSATNNGRIIINGGTIYAEGIRGAGIGGGGHENGGTIIIKNATVNAISKYIECGSLGPSGVGAAIGGGDKGYAGNTTIENSVVTALIGRWGNSLSGHTHCIGAGESKHGGGTITIKNATINGVDSRDGILDDKCLISLIGDMKVTVKGASTPVAADKRISALASSTDATLEPCEHAVPYINENVPGVHTVTTFACPYCGYSGQSHEEAHHYKDGYCEDCGCEVPSLYYEPGEGQGTPVKVTFMENTTLNEQGSCEYETYSKLPDGFAPPAGKHFIGWKMESYDESGTWKAINGCDCLLPGATINVKCDIKLYPVYVDAPLYYVQADKKDDSDTLSFSKVTLDDAMDDYMLLQSGSLVKATIDTLVGFKVDEVYYTDEKTNEKVSLSDKIFTSDDGKQHCVFTMPAQNVRLEAKYSFDPDSSYHDLRPVPVHSSKSTLLASPSDRHEAYLTLRF